MNFIQNNKYNQIFAEVLIASYLYYYQDKTIMSDSEFDQKFLLCKQNWDKITHKYKSLIDFEYQGTSLFYIREQDYPNQLKHIALRWSSLVEETK